jgi:transcriptional regulator with XRE-family HTH domain
MSGSLKRVSSAAQRQLAEQLAIRIGHAARAARLRRRMTQAQVAAGIHLSREVYARLERGRMMPSTPTLWRLCTFLRLSSDDLLGIAPADLSARPAEVPRLELLRALEALDDSRLRLLREMMERCSPEVTRGTT